MSAGPPARPLRTTRADYARFRSISTRWHDNDVYGHVNNVIYYAFFDTAVNALLAEAGELDPARSPVVGLVAETSCVFFESVAFPDIIEVGLTVERLGNRSVTYRLAVFRDGSDQAAAQGRFVHVYVDRETSRPVAIPASTVELLRPLAQDR